jgi:sec-independent protein translocase protein TatC
MTLMEHLAELRSRIIKSMLALVLGTVVVFLAWEPVQRWFQGPYHHLCHQKKNLNCLTNGQFIVTDPLEGFGVRLKVAGYGGLVLALPVILWQIWQFIVPGLHKKERRYAVPFLAASLTLFTAGAAVAWLVFPKALDFLVSYSGNVAPAFAQSKYISLLVLLMIGFGIGFLFPVFLVALELVGVVTPQRLARSRRGAIVAIWVVVAVATPSGDPYSLIALALPMCLFYEIAIIIGKIFVRRKTTPATG